MVVATSEREKNQTPFVRELKHIMVDEDIGNPKELHARLLESGCAERGFSRGTVYAILNGSQRPQQWFVRTLIKALNLCQERAERLKNAFVESY